MNFWDRITGNDMTRQMAAFAARVALLPSDYQAAWQIINQTVMARADFTGRNLMPILAGIVDMMEEAAADGLSVQEALGPDIADFADSVGAASGATNVQDRWRRQLNAAVYKKLGRRQP